MLSLYYFRRSCDRGGLRYERRGCDTEGNSANFIETEQLVIHGDHRTSFIQTRGSIPVLWSQPSTSLRPVPVLEGSLQECEDAALCHFARQTQIYGINLIVNLVELHGREAVVGAAYRDTMKTLNLPRIRYYEFGLPQCH